MPRPPLTPVLSGKAFIGPLKDMAQEVAVNSAGLEDCPAMETTRAPGERLRPVNSYYSNLIEGHKTAIPEIEQALHREFTDEPVKKPQEKKNLPGFCPTNNDERDKAGRSKNVLAR